MIRYIAWFQETKLGLWSAISW